MALTRSEQMARIRPRNTQPERLLRARLWAKGHRYRLHDRHLPGRPDLVFAVGRVAVFVDGCFWHGCPDHYVRPRSRPDFWAAKLRQNVDRDRAQTRALAKLGWRALRFWEHEVLTDCETCVKYVERALRRAGRFRRRPSWRVLVAAPQDADGTWERRILVSLCSPGSRVQRHRRHTRKW